jgi:hypothetical protein
MAEVVPISSSALVVPENLAPERDDCVARANALTITDTPSYEGAAADLKGIKALQATVSDTFDGDIKKADVLHKSLCATRRTFMDPLKVAEKITKGKIGDYDDLLERQQREEDARLAAEARKRDEEARLEEAVALDAAGEHEQAEQVLSDPTPPPPPVARQAAPKVAGQSSRIKYTGIVANDQALLKLVKAIADGRAPLSLVQANQSKINQMAQAMSGDMHFDGIEIKRERIVSSRK